jgi:hypothetical protein
VCLGFGVFKGASVWLRDVDIIIIMQYPQILHFPENGAYLTLYPYPGEAQGGRMSLAYYQHHQGWTGSQEFRDYMESHKVSEQDERMLKRHHQIWMAILAEKNGFDS